jgi:hypothetical protein
MYDEFNNIYGVLKSNNDELEIYKNLINEISEELKKEKEQNEYLQTTNYEQLEIISSMTSAMEKLKDELKLTDSDLKYVVNHSNNNINKKREELVNFSDNLLKHYKSLEKQNKEYKKKIEESELIQKKNASHFEVQIDEHTKANEKTINLQLKIESIEQKISEYNATISKIIKNFENIK